MKTRAAARRRAARGEDALADSPLLAGLLGSHPEGRAVWEARVAGRLSRVALAALASACRAGRTHRRERVADGEAGLLPLTYRDAYESPGDRRVAVALGLPRNHYSYATKDAAKYGTVETLEWALTNVGELSQDEKAEVWWSAAGAERQRVEKLELLHARIPGTWDANACYEAAGEGCMDALVWLHEHGAPWNERTTSSAAHRPGNLEALQYVVSHGCPWDGWVRASCLAYLRAHGHEDDAAWIEENLPHV